MFTHAPEHAVEDAAQVVQTPVTQACPSAHVWPQLPQFVGSVCVLVQAPPHSVVVVAHALHVPPAQICPAEHA